MPHPARTVVVVVSDSARPSYYQEVECGRHVLVVDESLQHGGLEAGPAPGELLLASLGACTAIALRKYCEARSWPVDRLMVTLSKSTGSLRNIHRTVRILGRLSDAQISTLAKVCQRTPMTRALKAGITIRTELSAQRVV